MNSEVKELSLSVRYIHSKRTRYSRKVLPKRAGNMFIQLAYSHLPCNNVRLAHLSSPRQRPPASFV